MKPKSLICTSTNISSSSSVEYHLLAGIPFAASKFRARVHISSYRGVRRARDKKCYEALNLRSRPFNEADTYTWECM